MLITSPKCNETLSKVNIFSVEIGLSLWAVVQSNINRSMWTKISFILNETLDAQNQANSFLNTGFSSNFVLEKFWKNSVLKKWWNQEYYCIIHNFIRLYTCLNISIMPYFLQLYCRQHPIVLILMFQLQSHHSVLWTCIVELCNSSQKCICDTFTQGAIWPAR